MKSLIRVFKARKIIVLRWHEGDKLLEVGWRDKESGGIMYRWIGRNGKFVR